MRCNSLESHSLRRIPIGELSCNRAYAEIAFTGGVFGTAAAVMIAGLAWLLVTMSKSGETGLITVLRWALGGVGLLIVVMLGVTGQGIGLALLGNRHSSAVSVAPYLGSLVLAACVAALVPRGMNRHPSAKDDRDPVSDAVKLTCVLAIIGAILSAVICGIISASPAGAWARPSLLLIDLVVFSSIAMPGAVLVAAVRPAVTAVTRLEPAPPAPDGDGDAAPTVDQTHSPAMPEQNSAATMTSADPGAAGGLDKPTSEPEATDRLPVEPMTRAMLRQRSLDTFSGGYQTHIAIIQGVALAILADRASAVLAGGDSAGWARITVIGQTAAVFMALITVSYEYLWFTSIMGWPLTFLDTLVPYSLGAGEIVAAQTIGRNTAWWICLAVLSTLGTLAFLRTFVKSRTVAFKDDDGRIPPGPARPEPSQPDTTQPSN